jgi:hypothetical protein
VGTADLERSAADSDPDAERSLDRPDMSVVLPYESGEVSRVVEVKFERVFGG